MNVQLLWRNCALSFVVLSSLIFVCASLTFADEKKDSKRFKSTVIELTDKASSDWLLKEAKVGTAILLNRGYALSELPDQVVGGTMIVREGEGNESKEWLKPDAVRALKDSTVYILVRWYALGKEIINDGGFTKLEREGWKEVNGETGTTFPAGEDWRWKTYMKKIKKGDVILQLKTLTWGRDWAVVYVFK